MVGDSFVTFVCAKIPFYEATKHFGFCNSYLIGNIRNFFCFRSSEISEFLCPLQESVLPIRMISDGLVCLLAVSQWSRLGGYHSSEIMQLKNYSEDGRKRKWFYSKKKMC